MNIYLAKCYITALIFKNIPNLPYFIKLAIGKMFTIICFQYLLNFYYIHAKIYTHFFKHFKLKQQIIPESNGHFDMTFKFSFNEFLYNNYIMYRVFLDP